MKLIQNLKSVNLKSVNLKSVIEQLFINPTHNFLRKN